MRTPGLRRMLINAQLPVRAATAAALSLVIAGTLELPSPLYAFIAAVIVTDMHPATSRHLGLRRILATIIGAGCGAGLSLVVPEGPVGVGLGTLAAMLLAQILKVGEGAKVAGYISGIVLLEHASEPLFYAVVRFVETLIGVLTAWGISYVPRLIRHDEGQRGHEDIR